MIRKNETCPKCGPGVFLANHPDRKSCGRCGYNPTVIAPPATGDAEVAPEAVVEEVAAEAPAEEAPAEEATETSEEE
uniref:Ribosomal protein S27AE n=1 Tax=uncultured marine group II/III euryarchaeote KM3_44_G05 TaxID=1456448 RepID=A0A075H230_9EURY|nr:Ribosomal protein S27AE [uncultured marine group II/III euryarchaeote KM3_44_G05]